MWPPFADPSAALPPAPPPAPQAPSVLTLAAPFGDPGPTLMYSTGTAPSDTFRQTARVARRFVSTVGVRPASQLRYAAHPEAFRDPRSWYQAGRLPTRFVSSHRDGQVTAGFPHVQGSALRPMQIGRARLTAPIAPRNNPGGAPWPASWPHTPSRRRVVRLLKCGFLKDGLEGLPRSGQG